MKNLAKLLSGGIAALCLATAMPATAAQLSADARAAIPHDVQQLIVIDYRAMQNSSAAMQLKNKVMPPELKSLEQALQVSGMNDNHDVDELAFASYRPKGSTGDSTQIIGLAQGQFSLENIMANFKKKKVKPAVLRDNRIYPMGGSGMQVVFLNPTTMVFGMRDSLRQALDARDGLQSNLLTNNTMTDMMASVQDEPLWSVLDQKGTQTMMRSLLGQASTIGDYDTIKKRILSSWYTMDFQNGVKFNLDVLTPDTFSAATMASLLNAAALYKKMSGTDIEKQAIDGTKIDSSAGKLIVSYSSSDREFATLLQSSLFQSVVH
ncbi:MAG: hypothetical protein QOH85_1808 [Acidobacteriaceae bacterium]|jgi:hypothetical protein|nr:hypothetical protein [Acidobacteriaceae bacterium]